VTRTAHPPAVTDRDLPLLLAVYGTLRRGCRNHHLLAGAPHVADGHVAGALHEITAPLGRAYSYPLLVVPGASRVVVEVYRVEQPTTLAALDALEAYDPDDVDGSEYVRVRVPLLDPVPGARLVQVYAYAGHGDGLGTVLQGGDWYTHAGGLG
jgi:gamma-glutamylcyclotransferase (GGCT)/AIG2-like uncharacterized protein YtfP